MKALKKYTQNGKPVFQLTDVLVPELQNENDVLIKIRYIGICSSDIHVLHGAMNMPDGNTVGHEFSGTIEKIGKKVKGLKPGDKVVCELAKGACMECEMCKSGKYELCQHKQPPGWKSQGVYTEYTVQPSFCIHVVPENVPLYVASMAEPIAICVYGCIIRAKISKDDFTIIYGMGSIGLFTLIALLDYGVDNIICVSSTRHGKERLNLAKRLGATEVFSTDEDIPKKIIELTNNQKADCVIDCSGAPAAINEGLNILRKDGKFIALGIASENTIPFAFNTGVLSVLNLTFSATSSHEAWKHTMGILERNSDKIKQVITHQFSIDEWEKGYQVMENRKGIKSLLYIPRD